MQFEIIEIGDTDLNRKIDLCNELLEIAEILEPGQGLFRGKLLIDLQEALSYRTERQLNDQTISVVTAQVRHILNTFCFAHPLAKLLILHESLFCLVLSGTLSRTIGFS